MFNQAVYNVLYYDDDIIVLQDVGDHTRSLTVTNDAERVAHKVGAAFPNKRIFYFDSAGELGEIRYNIRTNTATFVPPSPEMRQRIHAALGS